MAELKKINLTQSNSISGQSKNSPTPISPNLMSNPESKPNNLKNTGLVAIFILLGIATGYGLNLVFPSAPSFTNTTSGTNNLKVGDVVGVKDDKAFKDTTEGVVEKGGLNGEGSHKLVRPGGPSQTVYLTSSVVDLDEFVGTKVEVKGETFAAQKAGWLMDVGRVKVLELNAKVE